MYPTLRGEKRGFFGLTEPSGGSDPARAIRTTAERQGDDWILNGEKTFISGADKADFGLIFARTDPTLGREGISCFLIDTDMPGFHVRRVIHTLRSSHYATEIEIKDLRVPAANVSRRGQWWLRDRHRPGFATADPLRRRLHRVGDQGSGDGDRVRQGPGDLRRRSRDTAGDSMDDRRQRDRTSARRATLFLAAADRANRGRSFRTEAAMAKLIGTEASARVVDRVMQIHGGYGMTKDLPLERWWRELRIRRVGEGSERDPATDHCAQPHRPFTALKRERGDRRCLMNAECCRASTAPGPTLLRHRH